MSGGSKAWGSFNKQMSTCVPRETPAQGEKQPGVMERRQNSRLIWVEVSIPVSGRSPGEGNGNPLQYSCLGNSVDGRAWQATVHGVAKSWTRLSS